jgi:hypothetical protein
LVPFFIWSGEPSRTPGSSSSRYLLDSTIASCARKAASGALATTTFKSPFGARTTPTEPTTVAVTCNLPVDSVWPACCATAGQAAKSSTTRRQRIVLPLFTASNSLSCIHHRGLATVVAGRGDSESGLNVVPVAERGIQKSCFRKSKPLLLARVARWKRGLILSNLTLPGYPPGAGTPAQSCASGLSDAASASSDGFLRAFLLR